MKPGSAFKCRGPARRRSRWVKRPNQVIMHVGNHADAPGGIASVITGHCERDMPGYEIGAVASYDPRGNNLLSKNLPSLSALPKVLRAKNLTTVHVHVSNRGSLVREGSLLLLFSFIGCQVVVTLHGSGLLTASPLARWAMRMLLRRASVVHGFSELYQREFQVRPDVWRQIPNDVSVPLEVPGIQSRLRRIVFVGEVGFRKGADVLIEAWSMINSSGWVLDLVGNITDEFSEWLSERVMPENCELSGLLPHRDVFERYLGSRIVVLPSRAEAFPMTVCEGLGAGCAVIGTNVGAMGTLLRESGQMVLSELTSEELANSLSVLMEADNEVEERVERGRAYALSTLSHDVVSQKWLEVYSRSSRKNEVF